MDFTELFKHSSFQTHPSPCSRYLATLYQARLIIRDSESLQPVLTQVCDAPLTDLEWSPEGEFVLACSKETVFVYSLEDLKWKATIEEGYGGIRCVKWAPNGYIYSYMENEVLGGGILY